jgi:hypothetical protein
MYHCQKTAMSQVQEKTKQNPETNKNITIYNKPNNSAIQNPTTYPAWSMMTPLGQHTNSC